MEQYTGILALTFSSEEPNTFKLGLISSLDRESSTARVSLSDLSMSSYPVSNLLVLKDKGALYQELLTSATSMKMDDFKVLLRVNMLQERGGPSATIEAMELLKKNPGAILIATQSLSEKLGIAEKLPMEIKREGVMR